MTNCPCNPQKNYVSCCEPFITGKRNPEAPEALMRSRYTAYTIANIDYIKATMRGDASIGFEEASARRWAKRANWIKLHIFQTITENSDTGYVEFEASFVDGACLKSIHEKSKFIREEGRWYYVSGTHLPSSLPEQIITRNGACPCGSQRKFKNCHGND